MFAFPYDTLYAHNLSETLQWMVSNRRFKELVIYIESCESGSMLNGYIPAGSSIYGTTAATPYESSFACYWSGYRSTYLGDVYSVKWMQNSDVANMGKETVYRQFLAVRNQTNTSTVCQYGNQTVSLGVLGEFQGEVGKGEEEGEGEGEETVITDAVSNRRASIIGYLKALEQSLTLELDKLNMDQIQRCMIPSRQS